MNSSGNAWVDAVYNRRWLHVSEPRCSGVGQRTSEIYVKVLKESVTSTGVRQH